MKKRNFTKHFTIAIKQSMYDQMKAISDQQEVSIGKVARKLLDAGLQGMNTTPSATKEKEGSE